ncbi:hypothetical protein HU200_041528 [Digitaria exilis]|uniref:Uncharacterized protein n=1 Tax=Digitaria exilis TaxID=1010633 RepID=A0A835B6Q6_9POAL|nr:hypothetical protein HU200_041528 [Digitaria exilis]
MGNIMGNISTTSQDQRSNEQGSTEVAKASTSQNNEPVQKATYSDLGGTASTITEQIASASQRETTSTAQPDACILCDASSVQRAYEKPLQELQLEPDGALPDSGKDTPVSAFQLCNGADALLGANEHTNEPRTEVFCKPTLDCDATTIASVIPVEITCDVSDPAVSNGTITGNEYGEAKGTKPVEPHDDLIVAKDLFEKNIGDKIEAEEQSTKLKVFPLYILLVQTAVQNNKLGDGHSVVKGVYIVETGHMADEDDDQNNSPDTGHVNYGRQISSEDTAHVATSEHAQSMCSESSVQVDPCHGNLHKNKIKSQKHVKCPVVNFYFGSKQLLLASLKPRVKRKHKRTRRRSTSDANTETESTADDRQTSTSETIPTSGISRKSYRRKRSRNAASSEDAVQMYNKKQNLGNSCAAELTVHACAHGYGSMC